MSWRETSSHQEKFRYLRTTLIHIVLQSITSEDLGKKEESKAEVSAEDICSKKTEKGYHMPGVCRDTGSTLLLSLTWGTQ